MAINFRVIREVLGEAMIVGMGSSKKCAAEKCSNGDFRRFGRFTVNRYEVFDGFKFFFTENEWLMIRSSGTEPIIRLYAEAETEEIAQEIIFSGMKAIMEL